MKNQKIVFCKMAVDAAEAKKERKTAGEHLEGESWLLYDSGIYLHDWMEAQPDYELDAWKAYLHYVMEWVFQHYKEPEDKTKCNPLSFEEWKKGVEKPQLLFELHLLYDGKYHLVSLGARSSEEAVRNLEKMINTAKEYTIISVNGK